MAKAKIQFIQVGVPASQKVRLKREAKKANVSLSHYAATLLLQAKK